MANFDLVLGEGREGADVRGALGHDHVTRITEHPAEELQRLRAPGGATPAPGRAMDALASHQLHQHVTKPWVTLAVAVLQGGRPLLAEHLLDNVADHVERQRGGEGHAAGQAHDLGAGSDGEQRTDLRGGHRPGAVGVAIEEWVVGAHSWQGYTSTPASSTGPGGRC